MTIQVIVASPVDIAVTSPVLDTLATLVLFDVHAVDFTVSDVGVIVTVSCAVSFGFIIVLSHMIVAVIGTGVGVAVGIGVGLGVGTISVTVTSNDVIVFEPEFVVIVPFIMALPAEIPLTTPSEDTVATLDLLVVHFVCLMVSVAGDIVATSCNVSPISIVDFGAVIVACNGAVVGVAVAVGFVVGCDVGVS